MSTELVATAEVDGLVLNPESRIIAALVKRLGGNVVISADEYNAVTGVSIVNATDLDGNVVNVMLTAR